MKKLSVLKTLPIGLYAFFAVAMVSAQQPTGNTGPAQKMSDNAKQEMVKKNAPDTKKKEQVAQKEGFLLLPGFVPAGKKVVDRPN